MGGFYLTGSNRLPNITSQHNMATLTDSNPERAEITDMELDADEQLPNEEEKKNERHEGFLRGLKEARRLRREELDSFNIPILQGSKNFEQWWALIEDKATRRRWDEDRIRTQILATISPDVMEQVRGIVWTGQDKTSVWQIRDMLKLIFRQRNANQTRRQLETRKMKSDETVEEYGADIIRLVFMDSPAPRYTEMAYHFVNGLPPQIRGQVNMFRQSTNDIWQLIAVASDALLYQSDRGGSRPMTKRFTGKCHNCGRTGHKKNECRSRPTRPEPTCYACGQAGHISTKCPRRDAERSRRMNRIRNVIVDTGSEASFMSTKVANTCNLSHSPCTANFIGFGGNRVQVNKQVEVEGQTYYVHDNLGDDDLVIGHDYLEKDPKGKEALKLLEKVKQDVLANFPNRVMTISKEEGFEELTEEVFKTKNMSEEQKKTLHALLLKFRHVFDNASYVKTSLVDVSHEIELSEAKPVTSAPYTVPFAHRETLRKTIEELLDAGLIRESKSPYGAPVLFVKKADGTLRFCVDYRRLNDVTKKDSFPMTRHEDVFFALQGKRWFSSLDFTSGYWQVPMAEESIPLTAFTTPNGKYEWLVMPFGLCNAPSTFQRFSTALLSGFHDFAQAKLDDILIYSDTFQQHMEHLEQVLQRVSDRNGVLKPSKCKLAQQEVKHLGMIVTSDGRKPDPAKIRPILELKAPTNKSELLSWLSTMSYYRNYVKNIATMMEPLNRLMKKNAEFIWGEEQQKAFEKTRTALAEGPTLAYPDFSKTFHIFTDASLHGIGAMLAQEMDGVMRPIAFYSRQLRPAEKNYHIAELEALALVFAARKTREFTFGNPNVEVHTDNRALTFIRNAKSSTPKLIRWALELDDAFEKLDIRHVKGKDNFVADSLSRMLRIEWTSENGNLERTPDGRLIVPEEEREKFLTTLHEDNGHIGLSRAYQACREVYFWPGMYADMAKWIRSCLRCQQKKICRTKKYQGIHGRPETTPWKRIHIDFVGPAETTPDGNKYILSAIDYASKYGFAIPTATCSAKEAAEALEKEVFLKFGIPETIYSDQGTHFTGQEFEEFCRFYGVKHEMTTPYNQQANGICERFNATICDMIACSVETYLPWDKAIPKAVNGYNTSVSNATGLTPHEVVFGMKPTLLVDRIAVIHQEREKEDMKLSEWMEKRLQTWTKIEKTLKKRIPEATTTREETSVRFYSGDKVWLRKHVRNGEERAKFSDRWKGPYLVDDDSHASSPSLITLDGEKIGRVAARDLKVCVDWSNGTEDRRRSTRTRRQPERYDQAIPFDHLEDYEWGTA